MLNTILKSLVAADEHLTIRQVAVLAQVATMPHADCTVRGIATRLGVQKPVITRVADKLDIAGMMARKADPADRRSVLLILTPKGRRLIAPLLALDATERRAAA